MTASNKLIEANENLPATAEAPALPKPGKLIINDPEILLRKGVYDKVAAKIILQRFLDFYNDADRDSMDRQYKWI